VSSGDGAAGGGSGALHSVNVAMSERLEAKLIGVGHALALVPGIRAHVGVDIGSKVDAHVAAVVVRAALSAAEATFTGVESGGSASRNNRLRFGCVNTITSGPLDVLDVGLSILALGCTISTNIVLCCNFGHADTHCHLVVEFGGKGVQVVGIGVGKHNFVAVLAEGGSDLHEVNEHFVLFGSEELSRDLVELSGVDSVLGARAIGHRIFGVPNIFDSLGISVAGAKSTGVSGSLQAPFVGLNDIN